MKEGESCKVTSQQNNGNDRITERPECGGQGPPTARWQEGTDGSCGRWPRPLLPSAHTRQSRSPGDYGVWTLTRRGIWETYRKGQFCSDPEVTKIILVPKKWSWFPKKWFTQPARRTGLSTVIMKPQLLRQRGHILPLQDIWSFHLYGGKKSKGTAGG